MIKFSHDYNGLCGRTVKTPHYFCDTCECEFDASELREDVDGEMICRDCWLDSWNWLSKIREVEV